MDIFFTAGLLHDFGKLILHQVDTEYAAVSDHGKLYGQPLVTMESKRYGTNHAILGADIMRSWNLPNPLANLVANHHISIDEKDPAARSRTCFALANEMAHSLVIEPPRATLTSMPDELALKVAGMNLATCLALLPAIGKEVQYFLEF